MSISLSGIRQLKQVLKATSAPLAYENLNAFSEAVCSPLMSLLDAHGSMLFVTDSTIRKGPDSLWATYGSE